MFQVNLEVPYTYQDILLQVKLIKNEMNVRESPKEARKCIYRDEYEQFKSDYKYYSYSVCMTDCLKWNQIRACNCTHFILHRGISIDQMQYHHDIIMFYAMSSSLSITYI